MSRTLLIDADLLAYRCSVSNEERIDWGEGVQSHTADFDAAKRAASDYIEDLMTRLDGTNLVVCLSDDFDNFRLDIYPAYKSNRASTERPIHLYDLKEWLAETYPARMEQRLEADDVIGMMATEPHTGDRIMVSLDKDMQTIPGLLYRPLDDKAKVRSISLEEANRFHLWQTLVGDQVDGYPGCPGIGPKAAEQLLDHNMEYFRHEREITRGKRAGEIEVKWKLEDALHEWTPWSAVLSAYARAGLTESHALVQANLARILRHGDWDGRTVRPWSPKAN